MAIKHEALRAKLAEDTAQEERLFEKCQNLRAAVFRVTIEEYAAGVSAMAKQQVSRNAARSEAAGQGRIQELRRRVERLAERAAPAVNEQLEQNSLWPHLPDGVSGSGSDSYSAFLGKLKDLTMPVVTLLAEYGITTDTIPHGVNSQLAGDLADEHLVKSRLAYAEYARTAREWQGARRTRENSERELREAEAGDLWGD